MIKKPIHRLNKRPKYIFKLLVKEAHVILELHIMGVGVPFFPLKTKCWIFCLFVEKSSLHDPTNRSC